MAENNPMRDVTNDGDPELDAAIPDGSEAGIALASSLRRRLEI